PCPRPSCCPSGPRGLRPSCCPWSRSQSSCPWTWTSAIVPLPADPWSRLVTSLTSPRRIAHRRFRDRLTHPRPRRRYPSRLAASQLRRTGPSFRLVHWRDPRRQVARSRQLKSSDDFSFEISSVLALPAPTTEADGRCSERRRCSLPFCL